MMGRKMTNTAHGRKLFASLTVTRFDRIVSRKGAKKRTNADMYDDHDLLRLLKTSPLIRTNQLNQRF